MAYPPKIWEGSGGPIADKCRLGGAHPTGSPIQGDFSDNGPFTTEDVCATAHMKRHATDHGVVYGGGGGGAPCSTKIDAHWAIPRLLLCTDYLFHLFEGKSRCASLKGIALGAMVFIVAQQCRPFSASMGDVGHCRENKIYHCEENSEDMHVVFFFFCIVCVAAEL